jgi:hypothetical protein
MFDMRSDARGGNAAALISGLDADSTLRRAVDNRRHRDAAEVDELLCAAHWADLHGSLDGLAGPAFPGVERLVAYGGEGTPELAEFAPAELGAVLGVSTSSAIALVADALDLRHRLPALWARVLAGEVKPYIGRRVAEASRRLTVEAAEKVDAHISRWADRLTWTAMEDIVKAAVIEADPARAEIETALAEADEGVWLSRDDHHGTREIVIRTDEASALEFDAAVDQVAADLAQLGDSDPRNVRRAKAVGVLAHPQLALNLFGQATGRPTSDPKAAPSGFGRAATLFVHITPEAMAAGQGVARVEGVGPVTVEQVRSWLRDAHVTVKPILDLAGIAPVDSYEIPDRMRDGVHVVSPRDTFPFSSSRRRSGDIDHTIPFRSPDAGGPPGQTAIGKLAPMTRFHHRVKTHGRWQVQQPFPGILVWRSPHGRYFLVDHTGSRPLGSAWSARGFASLRNL